MWGGVACVKIVQFVNLLTTWLFSVKNLPAVLKCLCPAHVVTPALTYWSVFEHPSSSSFCDGVMTSRQEGIMFRRRGEGVRVDLLARASRT